MISVVIPAFNSAATIGEQLGALAAQVVDEPWEVVVADNGSTDDTAAAALAWTDRLPDLRVVDAGQRRGSGHARNVGILASRGDRVLLCDADDVVGPGWVRSLAAALHEHQFVGGLFDRAELNPGFASLWRNRASVLGPKVQHGFLVVAPTGNVGFQRGLFDALGGFDVALRRGQDTDFAWRAIQRGTPPQVVPEAIVYVRLPAGPRDWLRKGWGDGRNAVLVYQRHRDRGMRRLPMREALDTYRAVLRQLPDILQERDIAATCSCAYDAGSCAGRLVGSIRHRTWFP